MSQLGARFREAREARGLSIAEIATTTRILPRYVQALEDGDYNQLPGDVYARGFIRNYAQFLHLPADELMQLYRNERGQATDRIKVVPAAVPPRNRSCLMPSAFVSFFAILVLLGLFYLVAQAAGLTRRPEVADQATATAVVVRPTEFPTMPPRPSDAPAVGLPVTPTQPPPPEPTVPPAPSPPSAPLVVEVRIVPDARIGSWLEIVVDGRSEQPGVKPANWSQRFEAQREIFVRAGDASVVELIVNGENKGRMGTVRGGVAKTTIPAPATAGSTP